VLRCCRHSNCERIFIIVARIIVDQLDTSPITSSMRRTTLRYDSPTTRSRHLHRVLASVVAIVASRARASLEVRRGACRRRPIIVLDQYVIKKRPVAQRALCAP
jgi:hypothetical protein